MNMSILSNSSDVKVMSWLTFSYDFYICHLPSKTFPSVTQTLLSFWEFFVRKNFKTCLSFFFFDSRVKLGKKESQGRKDREMDRDREQTGEGEECQGVCVFYYHSNFV